jgi:hypothetical protein
LGGLRAAICAVWHDSEGCPPSCIERKSLLRAYTDAKKRENGVVAKGGIEPPAHGFSVAAALQNLVANSKIPKQSLVGRRAALPRPNPCRTGFRKKAQLWLCNANENIGFP